MEVKEDGAGKAPPEVMNDSEKVVSSADPASGGSDSKVRSSPAAGERRSYAQKARTAKPGTGSSTRSGASAMKKKREVKKTGGSGKEVEGDSFRTEEREIRTKETLYTLGQSLGKGGFGTVWSGLNNNTGEFVAIKQIPLKHVKDQIQSIREEITLYKMLEHENIVGYVDSAESHSYLYIMLEFVENGSVSQIVKKFGALSETVAARYTYQMLSGLKYLHEQGVIHRDIKGANIMSTKEGVIKIGDFGVATKIQSTKNQTIDVVGTPYWMAPEIIEMQPPGFASDIWSVGCTVIEFIGNGKPPYYDLQPMQALFRIVQDDHPPLPEGISPVLKDFLLQCFQKDPNLRKSAEQLLQHRWLTEEVKVAKPKKAEKPKVEPSLITPAGAGKIMAFASPAKGLARFAEREDGDDYEDDFLDAEFDDEPKAGSGSGLSIGKPSSSGLSLVKPAVQNSSVRKREVETDDDGFDDIGGGSDLGLKLQIKMTGAAVEGGDGFDELDNENFDLEVDEEREKAARLTADMLKQIAIFEQPPGSASDETIRNASELLITMFSNHPDQRKQLVTHRGVLPIMEMLKVGEKPEIILPILRIVNRIIEGDKAIQENLCLIGGIPTIVKFAAPSYDPDIRREASIFVSSMCHTSTLTLQMFIACLGLPVLINLLESNYTENKAIVLVALNGMGRVFTLSSKKDFCRLFAKDGVMPHLMNTLVSILHDRNSVDPKWNKQRLDYLDKILGFILQFAQADSQVKEAMTDPAAIPSLMNALDLLESESMLVSMLKTLRFVAMNSNTLESLAKHLCIERILRILSDQKKGTREVRNQGISTLYYLMRISRVRQTAGAVAGVISHLIVAIRENLPAKTWALQMMCDLAHSSTHSRVLLVKERAVEFYLGLLEETSTTDYWQVSGLDALAVWISAHEESSTLVESTVQESIKKLISPLLSAKGTQVSKLLDPLIKILSASPVLCAAAAGSGIIQVVVSHLNNPVALVRVSLVRVLLLVSERNWEAKRMVQETKLYRILLSMLEDESVLVRQMAKQLISNLRRSHCV